MPKFIIIAAVFPPEPVVSAKLAHDIASSLSISNQVTVLCPKPTRPYGFDFDSNNNSKEKFVRHEIQSFTFPKSSFLGRLRESLSFGMATAKYIRRNHVEIDIIYADTWPLFAQYFIVRAARKYNLPIVIHIQDIYPESLTNKLNKLSGIVNFILLPLDKYILKKSTSIIAISDYMKEYLSRTREISKNKISVVLNWQDESSFLEYSKTYDKEDKFTFMYLGNIGPVAGVDLLIDAFVMANIPNTKLIIAGSGSMKVELIKKAALNKVFDIQFWNVPEGKVSETQSKADVLLLPIKKGAALSSVPSKLPAYMFSAKPVICCADSDSDTAKCIKESNCGYVVEPDNREELSKFFTIISKLENRILEEMGTRGRQYALNIFSKEVNLQKLTSIINNLLN